MPSVATLAVIETALSAVKPILEAVFSAIDLISFLCRVMHGQLVQALLSCL